MRYIPHTENEIQRMLDAVGLSQLDELFDAIPQKQRLARPLDLRRAVSEQELWGELKTLAARNASTETHDCFLGAGVYPHFTPAVVDALTSRSEFTTAYTPYQPEISQGTLQTIFEWQTMICGLTGCDVANASMYDGASASAEAALMAMRATRRSKVVVAAGLHPHYRDVLRTYLNGLRAEIVEAPLADDGRTAPLAEQVDGATACVILQQPNFLGAIEDVRAAAEAASACGAKLAVTVTEALSLALLTPPGELGADIVCGEAQSFGVPMSLGGPHLGFMATRQKLLRQLPGRLVGETVDTEGRRGYVLTLATREQHIRREKATSNICTNQGLCLLMATIYLCLHGRRGLRALAELNLAKAEYAKARVRENPALSLPLEAPTFNEFVVGVPDVAAALERARADRLLGGLDLAPYAPDLGPALLVCTTELVSREAIDRLVAALAGDAS
ncbi:MAG: aminomethyl-transferring glycine dehydrogenase subunit GcvPA [Deltaproteobacteria bacterium]|nr:aminomethyl-transferring glycine dehydrogenase subunit GcvPA [Deltaproteobacteria bacterium]MBW2359927.1 aminomethyl-transferring glycine dehydrogenase subunit GcvPA [Deltaproteobacteria bacterium]